MDHGQEHSKYIQEQNIKQKNKGEAKNSEGNEIQI